MVHGWIYDIKTGLIKDLGVTFDATSVLPPIFRVVEPDNERVDTDILTAK
jgi:hypothetical protein